METQSIKMTPYQKLKLENPERLAGYIAKDKLIRYSKYHSDPAFRKKMNDSSNRNYQRLKAQAQALKDELELLRKAQLQV